MEDDVSESVLAVESPTKMTAGEDAKSMVELVMLAMWEQCAEKGLFRYDVTACSTKTLPGLYGFLLQLNEGRATKKRPTEFRVDRVVQEFDEKKFNFTKVSMQEVLFQIDFSASHETEIDPDATAGRSPDLVMINVSPIEYGHILLVPRVLDRLTQTITPHTMKLALQFTAAVGTPYFRLGYNSLGAYATINHLHFQGYYLLAPYPVERSPTIPLSHSFLHSEHISLSKLAGYPVQGWVFEMTEAFDQAVLSMAEVVGRVCMQLQEMNIPHNVLICDCGARVFVWPQCYAEKQSMGVVPEKLLDTGVNPAAFEIAGHVILKRRTDYEDMTQRDVCDLLSAVSLTEERFEALTESLT